MMTVNQLKVKLLQKKTKAGRLTKEIMALREEIRNITDQLKIMKTKVIAQKKKTTVAKKKK